MTFLALVRRSLTFHWRTNVAVCFGVAAAVSVLSGALIVGDSVRGSLRDLALGRLGRTDSVLTSANFFPAELGAAIAAATGRDTASLIASTAVVTHEPSGRRAASVFVYGIDEQFWRFHGRTPRTGVFASPALAEELNARRGDVLLTRLQKPSEIPLESLFSQKEDVGRTMRLTMEAALSRDELGEFSLRPQQGDVRALFVPLRRVQRDLDVNALVNTILIATGDRALERESVQRVVDLDDLGVTVEPTTDRSAIAIGSSGGIVNDALERASVETAGRLGFAPSTVFTYLANTIRIGDRRIPYSLVTAIDLQLLPEPVTAPAAPASAMPIALNTWAARELNATVGGQVQLEYYLWDPAAGLQTRTALFVVDRIVPIEGLAADRRLAPEYPGITAAESLGDWDPPFPIDLARVRPQDEQYWKEFRTTPKAFVPYERGRELWSTRYGRATSIRLRVPESSGIDAAVASVRKELLKSLDPAAMGVSLVPVRQLALQASGGATDFGEYFTYFSFFLVVSALLLAVMFFRLGVEQRLRQIGILRAAGFTIAHVRRLLLLETAGLVVVGAIAGTLGAIAYARAIVFGLRTWWVGAVGTTLLGVHIQPASLIAGALAGGITAAICVALALRTVGKRSPRALLSAHSLDLPVAADSRRASRGQRNALISLALAAVLVGAGFMRPSMQAGAFFGAGGFLLIASLFFFASWLRSREPRLIVGHGPAAVLRLGFRGASFRPVRSVLSAALIAAAAFIIVAVDAFRREGGQLNLDPRAGTGGFALVARTEVPMVQNPNEPRAREDLQLAAAPELRDARFMRFRLRPGDDASCLNLYRPSTPTLIAPERQFIDANRFTFSSSLASSEQEQGNPWLLLDRTFDDGAVPAIADATSLQYVLHVSVGDAMEIDVGGRPLVLRFVGALRDSVLQSEIVIGETAFQRLFPAQEGFRYFLIDAPSARTSDEINAVAEAAERQLAPFGFDAVSTAERLQAFHRVENTYLSTFQTLGGLGLLLGTFGLGAVLLRNVLERRRELALLRAVGYQSRDFSLMVLAENAVLLLWGLACGTFSALVAIAPAFISRGGALPLGSLTLFLLAVLVSGVIASLLAVAASVRAPVLESLRAE
jgi:ABC-type antimicrobial peptide transport system permease subunit